MNEHGWAVVAPVPAVNSEAADLLYETAALLGDIGQAIDTGDLAERCAVMARRLTLEVDAE